MCNDCLLKEVSKVNSELEGMKMAMLSTLLIPLMDAVQDNKDVPDLNPKVVAHSKRTQEVSKSIKKLLADIRSGGSIEELRERFLPMKEGVRVLVDVETFFKEGV